MPFTPDAFLDTLAAYNRALWPLAAALWVATVAVFVPFLSGKSVPTFVPRLLLAGHWLWASVMYHAFFFTTINPAGWLFAALFVVQGVLMLTVRSVDRSTVAPSGSLRHIAASVLIVYSLLYPLIVSLDGFAYPRMPTFGVPCPTTVLTIGFLIAVSTQSFLLSAIPIAWSVVGGSGAWLFGVRADIALPAAGVLLVVDLISSLRTRLLLNAAPRAFSPKGCGIVPSVGMPRSVFGRNPRDSSTSAAARALPLRRLCRSAGWRVTHEGAHPEDGR